MTDPTDEDSTPFMPSWKGVADISTVIGLSLSIHSSTFRSWIV